MLSCNTDILYICYIYILYLFTYLKFETLDKFDPPTPANFKVFNFFQGLGWVDKTNQTPQDQMSCALAWTLRFGERVACHSSSRGLNIWSIYCMMAYKAYHIPIEYISWDMCSIAMHRWIVETWRMHIMHNSWWYLVRQNMPFKKLLLYVTYNYPHLPFQTFMDLYGFASWIEQNPLPPRRQNLL